MQQLSRTMAAAASFETATRSISSSTLCSFETATRSISSSTLCSFETATHSISSSTLCSFETATRSISSSTSCSFETATHSISSSTEAAAIHSEKPLAVCARFDHYQSVPGAAARRTNQPSLSGGSCAGLTPAAPPINLQLCFGRYNALPGLYRVIVTCCHSGVVLI
jgi:hypothetical protein